MISDSGLIGNGNPEPGFYISRRQAAQALKVTTATLDKLATKHGIRTFQVPGHSRKWFDRQDVENLLAAAEVSQNADAAGLPGGVSRVSTR